MEMKDRDSDGNLNWRCDILKSLMNILILINFFFVFTCFMEWICNSVKRSVESRDEETMFLRCIRWGIMTRSYTMSWFILKFKKILQQNSLKKPFKPFDVQNQMQSKVRPILIKINSIWICLHFIHFLC